MYRLVRFAFAAVLAVAVVGVGPVSRIHAEETPPAHIMSTPEVVRQASRSIVRIEITGLVTRTQNQWGVPVNVDAFAVYYGTGFVIDDAGHVVTNNHVIHVAESWKGTTRLTVELPKDFDPHPTSFHSKAEKDAYSRIEDRNGRCCLVNPVVVGYDEGADLAVLQIPAGLLPALKFARPETTEVGEDVLSIGYALGFPGTPTVCKGIVSAVGQNYSDMGIVDGDLVQTDCAINHGNSGGPLLNLAGEVVGVNTYTLAVPGGQTQGMYLARSSRTTKQYVEELVAAGYVTRGNLGVAVRPVPLWEARQRDVPQGVLITKVDAGSAAAAAGLHVNEIVLRVGGHEVRSIGDLNDALAEAKTGQAVEVEYQDFQKTFDPPKKQSVLEQLAQALLGQSDEEPAHQKALVVMK